MQRVALAGQFIDDAWVYRNNTARGRIAELERALRERPVEVRTETVVERVEVPAVDTGTLQRLALLVATLRDTGAELVSVGDRLVAGLAQVRDGPAPVPSPSEPAVRPRTGRARDGHRALPRTTAPGPAAPSDGLSAPQQRILDALAAFEAVGLGQVAKSNVATWAHQSPASSGFANNLGWNQIWRQAKARPRDPLKHTDTWASGLLRLDQPHTYATLSVTRRGWDIWDILIGVTAGRLKQAGLTVDSFADTWQGFLEQVGDILYECARPSIGLIYAARGRLPDFSKPVLAHQFGVGWRTWFGPAYVQRYGRGWLRGLPDRTRELPDGGVGHALDRPLVDLVLGARDVYAPVWPYLDRAGITPFWPRRRRVPARSHSPMRERRGQ